MARNTDSFDELLEYEKQQMKDNMRMEIPIDNADEKDIVVNGVPAGQEKKEVSTANKIGGIFVLVIFAVGTLAAIVFSQSEPTLTIASVGLIFFSIGLYAVLTTKLTVDNLPLLAFPVFGGMMLVLPIIVYYQKKHPGVEIITQDTIIRIILVSMSVIGLCLLIMPPITHRIKLARCSELVNAKCVQLLKRYSRDSNGRTHYLYSPTWEYEYAGKTYVQNEGTYSNVSVPAVGEVLQIRIDPNEPSYLYRPVVSHRIITTIVGLGFFAAGIFALIIM